MKKNRHLTIRMIAVDAVLVAMYVVLVSVSFRTLNIRVTLDAFPLIVGAVMFGPVHGSLIGFVGSGIYQLFFSGYGITPTTLLWMLPAIARGLIVGFYSKHKNYEPKGLGLILVTVLSGITVTLLNTLAIYVDSIIYKYYSFELVFGLLIPKFIIGIVLAVIFALAVPGIVTRIRKNIKLPAGGKI